MEPFDLTLTQVNFEDQDQRLSSQDADSLTNIVHYDYDLEPEGNSIPQTNLDELIEADRGIRSKKTKPAKVRKKTHANGQVRPVPDSRGDEIALNREGHTQGEQRATQNTSVNGGSEGEKEESQGNNDTHTKAVELRQGDSPATPQSGSPLLSDTHTKAGELRQGDSSATSQAGSPLLSERSSSQEPSPRDPTMSGGEDPTTPPGGEPRHYGSGIPIFASQSNDLDFDRTFRAFTETSDALALQQSVIGSSSVMSPASAEDIAKAIARTTSGEVKIQPASQEEIAKAIAQATGRPVVSAAQHLNMAALPISESDPRSEGTSKSLASAATNQETTPEGAVVSGDIGSHMTNPGGDVGLTQGGGTSQYVGIKETYLEQLVPVADHAKDGGDDIDAHHQVAPPVPGSGGERTHGKLIHIPAKELTITTERSGGAPVVLQNAHDFNKQNSNRKRQNNKHKHPSDGEHSDASSISAKEEENSKKDIVQNSQENAVTQKSISVSSEHSDPQLNPMNSGDTKEMQHSPLAQDQGSPPVAHRDNAGLALEPIRIQNVDRERRSQSTDSQKSTEQLRAESHHSISTSEVESSHGLSQLVMASSHSPPQVMPQSHDTPQPITSQDLEVERSVGRTGSLRKEAEISPHVPFVGRDLCADSLSESHVNHAPIGASTPMKPLSAPDLLISTGSQGQGHSQGDMILSPKEGSMEGMPGYRKSFVLSALRGDSLSSSGSLKVEDLPPIGRSRSSSISSIQTTDTASTINYDLDEVLREKAKLEGQLEIMMAEAETAIRERANLQAQVSALQTRLKSHASTSQTAVGDRDALAADIETLRRNRAHLEAAIMDSHKLLEEQSQECKVLREDVQISQNANEKLQDKIREMRDGIKGKEMTVQALKNKIAELYVQIQTAQQSRMQAENEVVATQRDMQTLMNSKEWYQQQLIFAQEARTQLQGDITQALANQTKQAVTIEDLKSDNSRLKRQLGEQNRKTLKDKEQIAKYLEAIQADMMEREAAFEQIQRDRTHAEEMLEQRVNVVEEEKLQMNSLMTNTNNLESDLQTAKNELHRRSAQVAMLEHEQGEVIKRLSLSQEGLTQRDKTIDSLQTQLIELESKLREDHDEMDVRGADILKLKEERATLEVSLTAALEEKKTFDEALQMLKHDMGKVEKSFKQMRLDLNAKNEELEQMHKGKCDIETELERVNIQLLEQSQHVEVYNSNMSSKSTLVDELRDQKLALEGEVAALKHELTTAQNTATTLTTEKELLDQEIIVLKEHLTEAEGQLKVIQEEKTNVANELMTLKTEQDISQRVTKDNSDLKSRLAEVETSAHKDVGKYKAKILKLSTDLKATHASLKERTKKYETGMSLLSRKMKEAIVSKQKAESEVEILRRRFDEEVTEQKGQLDVQLQNVSTELETVRLAKEALEVQLQELRIQTDNELEEYRLQISLLEKEKQSGRDFNKKQKKAEHKNRKLAMDLEREKGRLQGVIQSHTSLKHHTSNLEETLAQKESSIVELDSSVQSELAKSQRQQADLTERLEILEETLTKERENVTEIKEKLESEKAENSKLKAQSEEYHQDNDQLRTDIELQKTAVELLRKDFDLTKEAEVEYKSKYEKLNLDYQALQKEVERLQRELSETSARNPVMSEQIQTLTWQAEQKSKALEALQQQMALSEQRQQVEVENLRHSLETSEKESEGLRSEVAAIRKEKFAYQAKLAEVRGALKASLEQNKKMKERERSKTKGAAETGNQGDTVAAGNKNVKISYDMEMIEKLIQSTSAPTTESKPLTTLKTCLTSLRTEISTLQYRINEHTTAVQHSAEHWREVEAHVKDLEEVCRTSGSPTDGATSPSPSELQRQEGNSFDI